METIWGFSDIEIRLLQTIGTFSAVIIALLIGLFKDDYNKWKNRPKLQMSVELSPPDCHKTKMIPVLLNMDVLNKGSYGPDPSGVPQAFYRPSIAGMTTLSTTGGTEGIYVEQTKDNSISCYYMRIWIQNTGKGVAERVQVFADKLYRKNRNENMEPVKSFLPMNLRWSHSHEIYATGISHQMGKHCDLGFILNPSERQESESIDASAKDETILHLDLEVAPHTKSHLISKGTYHLRLKIAAANAKPITETLEIVLDGQWYDDPDKMFQDGIGLKKL